MAIKLTRADNGEPIWLVPFGGQVMTVTAVLRATGACSAIGVAGTDLGFDNVVVQAPEEVVELLKALDRARRDRDAMGLAAAMRG
jgi:hypothetical protein